MNKYSVSLEWMVHSTIEIIAQDEEAARNAAFAMIENMSIKDLQAILSQGEFAKGTLEVVDVYWLKLCYN